MTKKSKQICKYLENEKSFSDEIKSIFHHFIPFKCQPHKLVKHTQTIRRHIADEMFTADELFEHV